MNSTTLDVADIILAQLGGSGRLSAMIGARQFVGDASSLTFKFQAPAKNKANCIVITLDAESDAYTVRFCRVGRAPLFTVAERGSVEGVSVSELRRTIETACEIRLSL